MSDISYLKNANTKTVVEACTMYGAIAFIGEGMTELQKLEALSAAVQDLNTRYVNALSFFTSTKRSDDSWESVTFTVEDFNPDMQYVRIGKVIRYKKFHPDIPRRADVIEHGPLMTREKAQAIVDVMNAQ